LELATEEVANPDIRDRGFIYLRLLTVAHELAMQVVLTDHPPIVDTSSKLDKRTLDELLANISTLASIYQKPPSHFVPLMRVSEGRGLNATTTKRAKTNNKEEVEEFVPVAEGSGWHGNKAVAAGETGESGFINLLGLGPTPTTPLETPVFPGLSPPVSPAVAPYTPPKPVLRLCATPDNPKCAGLQVEAMFAMHQEQLKLRLLITNQCSEQLDSFLVKFNNNIYAATPASQRLAIPPIPPGGQGKGTVTLAFGETEKGEGTDIQIAIKCALGTCVFALPLNIQTTLLTSGRMEVKDFASVWRQRTNEDYFELNDIIVEEENIKHRLEANNIFFVTTGNKDSSNFLYFAGKTAYNSVILTELELSSYSPRLCVNCDSAYAPLVVRAFGEILQK